MLDASQQQRLRQVRQDALGTKHLHQRRLHSMRSRNVWIDGVTLLTVVLYWPVRFLAKGTNVGPAIEATWEIVGGGLVVGLSVTKLIFSWQNRAERHATLMGDNIGIAGEAERLLSRVHTGTQSDIDGLVRWHESVEKNDRDTIGKMSDGDRQWAYREGLKELDPSSTTTVCAKCGASPWDYSPGTCQVCGGTPSKKTDH